MNARKLILIILIAIIGIIGLYAFFLFTPTLYVEKSDQAVQIKTLSLGEYYTSVEVLNIYEVKNNIIVVSFKACDNSSRMHTVTIKPEINSFDDMYLKDYNISYPTVNNYKFKINTLYKAVVQWPSSTKEIIFILERNESCC